MSLDNLRHLRQKLPTAKLGHSPFRQRKRGRDRISKR